jgi:hypothetical protein
MNDQPTFTSPDGEPHNLPPAPGWPPSGGQPGARPPFDVAASTDQLDAMFGTSVGWMATHLREHLTRPREQPAPEPNRWSFVRWPIERDDYLDRLVHAHHRDATPAEHFVCPVLLRSPSLPTNNLQRGRVAWAYIVNPNRAQLLALLDAVAPDAWAVEVGSSGATEVFRPLEQWRDANGMVAANRDLAQDLGAREPAELTSLVRVVGAISYRTPRPQPVRFLRALPMQRIDRYYDPRTASQRRRKPPRP